MTKKRSSNTDKPYADINEPYEEFILADLDLMREDWELGPVSLADVMDDHHIIENQEFDGSNTFDKPTCVIDFDINEQQAKTIDYAAIEPLNIDIVTETTANNHIDSLQIPIKEPSLTTIEKLLVEDPFENALKLKNSAVVQEAITGSFHPDDSLKSVMAHYENKYKKLLKISYAALVFSLSTLLAMAFLSTMVYNTVASNAKLNELVSLLEIDIRTLTSKYESLEINHKNIAIDPSNNQLIENIIKPIPVPTKNKRIPLKFHPHGSQLKHRSQKQKNELR